MFFHFNLFSKKMSKLDWIATILIVAIGLFFTRVILSFSQYSLTLRWLMDINGDMFQFILLLSASLILGIAYIVGQAYRKFIKGVPKCAGCSNPIEKYIMDLLQEKLKCRLCGYESTFNQFPDKIFLHDKITKMLKRKDLDPIIKKRAQDLVFKFENFEFDKRPLKKVGDRSFGSN